MSLLIIRDNKALVSSRQVSEHFEKRHDNVIRDIETVLKGLLNFEDTHYFIKSTYIHPQNKQPFPEYLMNRDGFSLLAMGFTGAKALQWKLKYIEAFNEMEKQLKDRELTMFEKAAIASGLLFQFAKEINELKTSVKLLSKAPRRESSKAFVPNDPKDYATRLIKRIAKVNGSYGSICRVALLRLEDKYCIDAQAVYRKAVERIPRREKARFNKTAAVMTDPCTAPKYISILEAMASEYGV